MTLRAEIPRLSTVASHVVATPQPASLVPLLSGVSAVVFDSEGTPRPGERARLTVSLDGTRLNRPMVSTSLELASGGQRHVLLLGLDARTLASHRIDLGLGPQLVAAIDPDWLQPPLADGGALIDGLGDQGRRRLLKLFLTTGASLFGQGDGAAFAGAARDLMGLMGVQTARFVACCPIGRAGHILTFDVPVAPEECLVGEMVSLDEPRMRRVTGFRSRVETARSGSRLYLFLTGETPPAMPMVSIGPLPILLPAPDPEAGLRPIVPWLERTGGGTRRWAEQLIGEFAERDPATAMARDEILHADEAPPAVEMHHLSATSQGILFALTLKDPCQLIRGIQVERGGATMLVPVAGDGWPSTRHARYLALARADWRDDMCRFRLLFRSGRLHTTHEQVPSAFDGRLPGGWPAEEAEAIALARLDHDPVSVPRRVRAFGQVPIQPSMTLLAAVGDNIDLIRARAAILFPEPGTAGVELLYHVEEGQLARAAEAAIDAAVAVFGLPHRLITVPAGTTASGRLLASLAEARGTSVLLLGPDVLPAAAGWLAPLRRAARSREPMLAPVLAGPDGSVQNDPRYLGLPLADVRVGSRHRAVSADCTLLQRSAVEMLVGFTRPYPNPDIVLAEAAARLGASGFLVRRQPRSLFIRYCEAPVPGALERMVDAAALRRLLAGMVGGEVRE